MAVTTNALPDITEAGTHSALLLNRVIRKLQYPDLQQLTMETRLMARLSYLLETSAQDPAQMTATTQVIFRLLTLERQAHRSEYRQEFQATVPGYLLAAVHDPQIPFKVANKAAMLMVCFFDDSWDNPGL